MYHNDGALQGSKKSIRILKIKSMVQNPFGPEGVYIQRVQWMQTQGECYIQVPWMQELLRDAAGCSLMQADAGWMQNGLLMDAAGAFDPDAGLDAGCRPPLNVLSFCIGCYTFS